MAPPISDAVVVDVLRRVDRLLSPLAQWLARPAVLPETDRDEWWAGRAPRVAAVIAAAPRFAGKLADLLPLQTTVGTAVQSLVVLGVAAEHQVKDSAERISLLARVLLGRDLGPEQVEPLLQHTAGTYREVAFGGPAHGLLRRVWRASRLLARIDETLDARPKGRLHHRALSNLPVVGVFGGYAAEREGLRRAANRAAVLLSE
jgi:hypothetical protein